MSKNIDQGSENSADNKESEKRGKDGTENKNRQAIDMIIKSIGQLQYGTITITIHNGSIVQVETNTKQRFA